MVSEVPKMIVCDILVTNPNLRRVWSFGGIFCLTFFREGCSPAARLDEPPLAAVNVKLRCFQSTQKLQS